MKTFFLSLFLLLFLAEEQSIAQQPGDVNWSMAIDPDGDPNAYDNTIYSIKVQTDEKIVAAGASYSGWAIAVGRFSSAGSPDSSFGINGMVTTLLDSAYAGANAMQIQSDGKIVVAGGYKKGVVRDFIVVRYKPDGTLDSSFGVNGIVQTDISPDSLDMATALVIQTDGKIVVAGRSGSLLALCRYHTDGTLDSSFDLDGKLTKAVAGATCMMLQTNGKIVVGCGSIVTRLHPDGSPDVTFGVNAIATLASSCLSMAIQNDGKILLAGGTISGLFALERLDTAGVQDNSFGNGGVVMTGGFTPSASRPAQAATAVCLQADGRILASGWTKFCIVGNCRDFAVARYKSNGKLDSSFGWNGLVDTYIPSFGASTGFSAVINHNNELVVAGTDADDPFTGPSRWAMVGYDLGPALDVHTVAEDEGPITLAPNPSSGILTFSSPATIQRIEITDLTGKVVYRAEPAQLQAAIDLSGKASGIYFYEVDCGAGKQRGKLVKE